MVGLDGTVRVNRPSSVPYLRMKDESCLGGSRSPPVLRSCGSPLPTLYVPNQGATMKLRFGGKAVPT